MEMVEWNGVLNRFKFFGLERDCLRRKCGRAGIKRNLNGNILRRHSPINNHGGELPVADYLGLVIGPLHAIRNKLQLLKDVMEIFVRAAARYRVVIVYCGGSGESGVGNESVKRNEMRWQTADNLRHLRCRPYRRGRTRHSAHMPKIIVYI
jgi:hypothetical protein